MITGFFGPIRAGCVPAVMPTPRMFERIPPYVDRLGSMLNAASARSMLVSDALAETAGDLGGRLSLLTLDEVVATGPELDSPVLRHGDATALVQLPRGRAGHSGRC